jgi:phosphoglycolate phosphatase-like HAD superfamily hydrolase
VLIGDSDFDMPAAENAGALSIGFVDEPWKAQTLGEAGPNALVGTMSQLAAAITDAG